VDYIIANHTEPDHSGLIPDLLELHPDATVVGSKVCLSFLQNLVLKPFKSQAVKVRGCCVHCPSLMGAPLAAKKASCFHSFSFVVIYATVSDLKLFRLAR
jgi:hypothetical protein